jgi:hypothetical protein
MALYALIRRSRIFFDDLPNIHRRREARAHVEMLFNVRQTRPGGRRCRSFMRYLPDETNAS